MAIYTTQANGKVKRLQAVTRLTNTDLHRSEYEMRIFARTIPSNVDDEELNNFASTHGSCVRLTRVHWSEVARRFRVGGAYRFR